MIRDETGENKRPNRLHLRSFREKAIGKLIALQIRINDVIKKKNCRHRFPGDTIIIAITYLKFTQN